MLVLLVIFMVTAPLINPGQIDLPSVGSKLTVPAEHRWKSTLATDGTLTLADKQARHRGGQGIARRARRPHPGEAGSRPGSAGRDLRGGKRAYERRHRRCSTLLQTSGAQQGRIAGAAHRAAEMDNLTLTAFAAPRGRTVLVRAAARALTRMASERPRRPARMSGQWPALGPRDRRPRRLHRACSSSRCAGRTGSRSPSRSSSMRRLQKSAVAEPGVNPRRPAPPPPAPQPKPEPIRSLSRPPPPVKAARPSPSPPKNAAPKPEPKVDEARSPVRPTSRRRRAREEDRDQQATREQPRAGEEEGPREEGSRCRREAEKKKRDAEQRVAEARERQAREADALAGAGGARAGGPGGSSRSWTPKPRRARARRRTTSAASRARCRAMSSCRRTWPAIPKRSSTSLQLADRRDHRRRAAQIERIARVRRRGAAGDRQVLAAAAARIGPSCSSAR